MADLLSAELSATCAVLGYYDGSKYYLDKDALAVIKDLIRYLKRDSDDHEVRCYLGETQILQTDLIKIFVEHSKNTELWDVLLRLIINLTSPAFIIYNEEVPKEKTSRNTYQKIVSYLQAYKVALTDDRVWSVVSERLKGILETDPVERGEENEMIIERILIFLRNVLQVPPNDNETRAENDATVHDEVLFALHTSGMVDLLVFIASRNSEQQYHMQILEIISLMLREQNAAQLASVGLQRSALEKQRDEAKLVAIREKEVQQKMEKMRKYAGSRHSRFGGTYVVQNMKAIGDNQLICHKPYQKIEALEFGQQKGKVKKPKNKLAMADKIQERTSALSVRLFLKEFCVEFLNAAYNPVMRYARSCIAGGGHGSASEGSCYLWALRFFMEFNRHYKFEVKYVSETISTEVFHLVQRQMEQYYEMMLTDKKKIPLWSQRLHYALKAYQELLHTLMAMDKSIDEGVRESSKVIKSNVFYVPEYRETILSQLLCYDELKMSRAFLVDLVTTVHIFLKMLEQFCKKRTVIVQKKKRAKGKKRKRKPKELQQSQLPSLEVQWDDVGPELSAVMQEGVTRVVVPFDATSSVPVDEQKPEAMKNIQRFLRRRDFEGAIGLLRSAREVWPENDCFGKADISSEEEFLALREIFFADLGVEEENATPQANTDIEKSLHHEEDSSEEEDDDNEEDEEREKTIFEETNFKFSEFLARFANVKVVKALALLLQSFDGNSTEVNHYVVKMLHRIAWDCKTPGMIFQASIFRTFQRILESKVPQHQELQKFAKFIIRRFTEVAQKNRKSYMELLFWKTTREATEMVDGYDAETENKKVSRAVWSDAEEDELRTLFMEHQTNKYPQDLIDWLLENLIDKSRTSRGVMKKLKEMCLIVNSKATRNEVQKRLPKEWAEHEIAQLAEIWEEVKDDEDPVDMIYNGLTIKRPKGKIKEKLLELGLAKDRKELRKKRTKKSNYGKSSWETQSVSHSNTEEDSDEETSKSVTQVSKTRVKKKGRISKQPTIVYTDAQLSGLLKDVIGRDMSEALEWVKESLEDVLEDRDEETSEGVPLVPLTDYSSTAMESPSFQRFLKALGIEPPADEQEAYWRIPANMMSSTIRKRCVLIADALEGKFITEETPEQRGRENSRSFVENEESSDDEDVLENIKKFFGPKPTRKDESGKSRAKEGTEKAKVAGNEENDDEDVPENIKKSFGSKPTEDEEEEEEEGEGGEEAEEEEKDGKSNTTSRLKNILESSSESDMEIDREKQKDAVDSKRDRSDVSDGETPSMKKRRLVDSDEEEGNIKETSAFDSIKSSRRIISDDDDED